MNAFVALINSNSASSVNVSTVIQNLVSIVASGSAGSLSNGGVL